MNKKILSILLIGAMLIGVTGCGKKESYINITNKNNEVQKYTTDEFETLTKNELLVEEYVGQPIEIEGVVERIESCQITPRCTVTYESGAKTFFINREATLILSVTDTLKFHIYFNEDNVDDLKYINIGDTVKVTSNLIEVWNNKVDLISKWESNSFSFGTVEQKIEKIN